jgi:dTDP-4-dehydrorhamnose 3,5-epimerase
VKTLETRLDGLVLIEPQIFGDERGFLHESYRRSVYTEAGIDADFIQDNHSRSARGVLRGMHFQIGRGMAKLVRCARGAILDVAVDIRRGSPTFGEWEAFELNDENLHQLYLPIGFAHGFCTLSEQADVLYRCDAYYSPDTERGISYRDPDLAIEWPDLELTVSERDANAPNLAEVADELPFVYAASPVSS